MKKIIIKAGLIVIFSSLVGVGVNLFSPQKIPFIRKAWVIQEELKEISLAEAKRFFDEKKALFIDGRSEKEFQKSHIEGAINLDSKEFYFRFPAMAHLFSKNQSIITYCGSLTCPSSIDLAQQLMRKNFKNVLVFKGGWVEWKNADYPLVEK